jgi:hypothetical protein
MDSSSHDHLRSDEMQDSFDLANCSHDDEMTEEDSTVGSKVTDAPLLLCIIGDHNYLLMFEFAVYNSRLVVLI